MIGDWHCYGCGCLKTDYDLKYMHLDRRFSVSSTIKNVCRDCWYNKYLSRWHLNYRRFIRQFPENHLEHFMEFYDN